MTGWNSVHEALLAGRRRISNLLIAEGSKGMGLEQILALAESRGVPVQWSTRQEMERLAGELAHQGVIALASPYPYVSMDDILALAAEREELPFVLVLDSLEDPQNLGAVLRTAEVVGVHGAIIPKDRAARVTPTVSRTSAGAVEHLAVALVTNLAKALQDFRSAGLWVIGAEDHPEAQDYRQVRYDMPLALVLGSEGRGMRRLIREKCDILVRLPMRGRINSLNVAAAGAVLLYHAATQRQGWL